MLEKGITTELVQASAKHVRYNSKRVRDIKDPSKTGTNLSLLNA